MHWSAASLFNGVIFMICCFKGDRYTCKGGNFVRTVLQPDQIDNLLPEKLIFPFIVDCLFQSGKQTVT